MATVEEEKDKPQTTLISQMAQINTMEDVSDRSLNQVSRAASATGFLAAIAMVRGLTPPG